MVVCNVPGISPATHLKLDGKLLARIYAGQITTWDDRAIAAANQGVKRPGTSIVLVHRGDDSGSRAISSGAAQLAQVNFQPLPSSVVTLSGTQIAQIEG